MNLDNLTLSHKTHSCVEGFPQKKNTCIPTNRRFSGMLLKAVDISIAIQVVCLALTSLSAQFLQSALSDPSAHQATLKLQPQATLKLQPDLPDREEGSITTPGDHGTANHTSLCRAYVQSHKRWKDFCRKRCKQLVKESPVGRTAQRQKNENCV